MARGKVDRIGSSSANIALSIGITAETTKALNAGSVSSAVAPVLQELKAIRIDAVGHRIVHGGPSFFEPVLINDTNLAELEALTELAPLHNPGGLAGIIAVRRELPHLPNFAIFDTAFHHNLPAIARTYALPRDLTKKFGLRRYGFHGISTSYVSQRLKLLVANTSSRHIICHLGNGASVTAVRDGDSVDTSMGFTPLEGLIMGTRSGDVDPGILLHLQRAEGMTLDEMENVLNHKSGLHGLSGKSADVRDLEQAGDEASELALECFAYRASKYVGAFASALGGVDALAFTGGIGQYSFRTRRRICQKLGFLGLSLDLRQNEAATGNQPLEIGQEEGRVWIVPTDEERQIAREGYHLIA